MKKLFAWISSLFDKTYDLIEDQAPMAVIITQKIKLAIEEYDGKIESILDKTETKLDNKVYDFIKNQLPFVMLEIAELDNLVTPNTPVKVGQKVYIDHLLRKTKNGRVKDFVYLAAMILKAIASKKLPDGLFVLATQKAYHLIFGQKK